MVIAVEPGAPAQNAHVDTQDEGSISVHIPLHSLHDGHWDKKYKIDSDVSYTFCTVANRECHSSCDPVTSAAVR